MRRLWYQDSYGYWHRDRQAERGASGGPSLMRVLVIVLLALTALVVIASLVNPLPSAHP